MSRVFATSSPRKRSAWGQKVTKDKRNRRKNEIEIVHSSMEEFLSDNSKSVLDVDYKICFPKEHNRHVQKQKQQQQKQQKNNKKNAKMKMKVKVKMIDIDISERMKSFNYSEPSKIRIRNLDKQTSMDVLKGLEDIGMIGKLQFTMTTPSFSDFASFNPGNYELTELTIHKSNTPNNLLTKNWKRYQDRDLQNDSRRSLKQHLASLALRDLTGPEFDWTLCSYSDLKAYLMEKAGIHEPGKINLSERMKEFNVFLPPDDPVVNKEGDTALTCLKQLKDVGLIGETRFTLTTPSNSRYASFDPKNYEHIQLVIQKSEDDGVGVLRQDLEYGQDRDVNKQSRVALKQHLGSLALCDITGPQRRWTEMTFSDLRNFLKEKSTNVSLLPPIE